MQESDGKEKKAYKNFRLAIFDAWLLFNQEIPKQIRKEKLRAEIKEEREKKLAPPSDREKFFSESEVALIKELISNPRKSYLELAENLELSRHTVKKRIEKMKSQGKMQFCVGINYKKLSIDLLFVNIFLKNLRNLEEMFQELQICPKIFLVAKDISKGNLQVLFGVEKTSTSPNQYVGIIEQLQLDDRVKECTITSLNPELFPHYLLFSQNNFPVSDKRTPCGRNCSICEKYIDNTCAGCPGFQGYQGQLFKLINK